MLPAHVLDLAYWLLLWREASPKERHDAAVELETADGLDRLFERLLASTEFRMIATYSAAGQETGRKRHEVEAGFARLGGDESFIEWVWRALLGREVDPGGREFYLRRFSEGMSRRELVVAILRSEEFVGRYGAICPQAGFLPRDVQLCELANPAKWSNPDWVDLLRSLVLVPTDPLAMHRKAYEFGQLLFGLERLGAVRDDVRVLSVGAGHEPVLYWLANRVGRVIATDMYGGVWQAEGAREGDEAVLVDPRRYAPFAYREERLLFMKMDGRRLAFRDDSFDVVYSLSSIEHFGGVAGAREAIAEMARVLKPGGVLAIATEYVLNGVEHHEAFQPDEVRALSVHPSLGLVAPIDEGVWRRHDYQAIDLRKNPHQTPHMVVTDLGAVFTSVMAFLRKDGVLGDNQRR
jgi:SAM-dependent methyltransferase